MVSIPPLGICSLRPVFITDLPHFEVLIQLPKHGHVFSLSLFMGFHVRHMGSVQNLLDFPDSSQMLGRTSEASQVTQTGMATPTPTVCCAVLYRCLPTHNHCVKHSPTLRGYFVTSRGSIYQAKMFFFPRASPLFFGIQRDES